MRVDRRHRAFNKTKIYNYTLRFRYVRTIERKGSCSDTRLLLIHGDPKKYLYLRILYSAAAVPVPIRRALPPVPEKI